MGESQNTGEDADLRESVAPQLLPCDETSDRLPHILDYYKWAYEQAGHIREGRFDQVDILNVADEIEDVGKREFEGVVSRLEPILLNMLKWDHQPSQRLAAWADMIAEHRERLTDDLADSPSLTLRLPDAIQRAYRYARHGASEDTRLALEHFPETCPYDQVQIMETSYEIDRD